MSGWKKRLDVDFSDPVPTGTSAWARLQTFEEDDAPYDGSSNVPLRSSGLHLDMKGFIAQQPSPDSQAFWQA